MRALVSTAVLAGVGMMMLTSAASAQPRENCLAYRDLEQLHAVDNRSAIATTRRDAYMVNFRGTCQAMGSAAFFILDDRFHGFCVRPGDRMELSEPAPPCVVASVTHLRSVRIRDRR
jgi:hypothetical protein